MTPKNAATTGGLLVLMMAQASLGCLLCAPSAILMRKSLIICSYIQENRNFLLKKNDEV